MANFCPKCGAKVSEGKKFCGDCGCEVDSPIFSNTQNNSQTNAGVFTYAGRDIDRTPEKILAILGGVFGIIDGAYSIYVASYLNSIASTYNNLVSSAASQVGSQQVADIGSSVGSFISLGGSELMIIGIITIIVGIIAIFIGTRISKNPTLYGIILIVLAFAFLIGFSWYGIGCGVLVGVSGILALVRK